MTPPKPMSRGPWRLTCSATLDFDGPVCIGSGIKDAPDTDTPVLRDTSGACWIPGRSLRGVLRDWCEREAAIQGVDLTAVRRLFGAVPKGSQQTGDAEHDREGRLRVFDVYPEESARGIRDHARHEAAHGAVADGGLFDGEVVYLKAATFMLTYEGDGATDPEVRLLRAGVQALESRVLQIGGKVNWGFGGIRVRDVSWQAIDRGKAQEHSRWLTGRLTGGTYHGAAVKWAEQPPVGRPRRQDEPRPWSWLELDIAIQFDGPMLVAGVHREWTSTNANECNKVFFIDAGGRPTLPGSSLRGALRAQGRRIAGAWARSEGAFERLLGPEPYGPPGLGHAAVGSDAGGGDADDAGAAKGLLRIGEGQLFGQSLDTPGIVCKLNHVAVDRITHQPVDKKLFSVCALASPMYMTRLLFKWHSDREVDRRAGVLLYHLVRDLRDGRIRVGAHTTRGYGAVAEANIRLRARSFVQWTASTDQPSELIPSRSTVRQNQNGASSIATLGRSDAWGWATAWEEPPQEGLVAGGEA